MKNAPPNEIDFRDPDQDETFDIDRLLEQEMKKRQLEIVPVTNGDIGNTDRSEFDMDNNTMKMNIRNEVSEFIKEPSFDNKNGIDHILSSPKSSTVISFQEKYIDVEADNHTFGNDMNRNADRNADMNSDMNTGILNRLKTVDTNSYVERNPTTIKPLKSILKKPNNKTDMYHSYYIYKTQLSVIPNTNTNANTNANVQNEFIVTVNDPSVRNFSQNKHIIIESIIMLKYPTIPNTLNSSSSNYNSPPIPVIALENQLDTRIFLPSTIQPFLFSGEFCLPTSNTFKIRSLNNNALSFDEICIQYKLV